MKTLMAWTVALALLVTTSVALAQPGGMGPMAQKGPYFAPTSVEADAPAGSISIRVVDGDIEKPISDAVVTLVVDDKAVQTGRSAADGSIEFQGEQGVAYRVDAKIPQGILKSEDFGVPQEGGVSVILSTNPLDDRGGRPSARMMSGRARPESKDPPHQLTVRAIRGELEQSQFGGLVADIPEGAKIHLVGVDAKGEMHVRTQEVEKAKEGRVVFDNLARRNELSYYALSVFERPGGSDRLMTEPLRFAPMVGSRMMFAGAALDSASTGVDDLDRLNGTGLPMPGAGEIQVRLWADPGHVNLLEQITSVELVEASAGPQGSAATKDWEIPASAIAAHSQPIEGVKGTPPGQVLFFVARPEKRLPLEGVEIVIKERIEGAAEEVVTTLKSGSDGRVLAEGLDPTKSYVAVATYRGREVRSEVFSPNKSAGLNHLIAFDWNDQPIKQAEFQGVASGPDKIYMVRTFVGGRRFVSMPFQLTESKGAIATIYLFPEIVFSMQSSGPAELDDDRFWFPVTVVLMNPGVAPVEPDERAGFLIPLPKDFRGASVEERMAATVGVEPGLGLRWRGNLPPGSPNMFNAVFAIPVDDGKATFDLPLPWGLRFGAFVVEELPGAELRTPSGTEAVADVMPNKRRILKMLEINIAPQQRLVFGLRGLPQSPKWQYWAKVVVGVVVILLVLWGLFIIFRGARGTVDPVLVELEKRRETLMDELVEVERKRRHAKEGKEAVFVAQRDKLKAKLAKLYIEIDEHEAGQVKRN